jgi:vesicle coat complex subunit
MDFVKKSIQSIGKCAMKLSSCAEICVSTLLELMSTKITYIVQEVIIIAKDILRKYPHQFESIIPELCQYLDILTDSEAKASIVWIIGEYAERILNVISILDLFLDNFLDEPFEVQCQLLTAAVKTFLKKPSLSQNIIERMLKLATESTQNPDLRDRAFIYWRLLSSDPKTAKVLFFFSLFIFYFLLLIILLFRLWD